MYTYIYNFMCACVCERWGKGKKLNADLRFTTAEKFWVKTSLLKCLLCCFLVILLTDHDFRGEDLVASEEQISMRIHSL